MNTFQSWRAVAVCGFHMEVVVFVGKSSTHVRQEYCERFAELQAESDVLFPEIHLQEWQGEPYAGKWVVRAQLKLPSQVVQRVPR